MAVLHPDYPDSRPISTKELSDWIGVPELTLHDWRKKSVGPPYYQPIPRGRVTYYREDVERWMKQGKKANGT